MTEAKDWITAQPKASGPAERTPEQKAAFDQLLKDDGELYDVRPEQTQQTDVERVARAIVSELVGPNEWKEMGAAEIQTACDAARAALSAMRPSIQQTDVERAAWEGVRAMFEHRHGVGTCPNERLEDLKRANEVGETWEEYLIAARAAISAMRPSVSVDWEKIEKIKHKHIATSHDIENGNYCWDDFSAEAIHADRAYLLSLIGGSHD